MPTTPIQGHLYKFTEKLLLTITTTNKYALLPITESPDWDGPVYTRYVDFNEISIFMVERFGFYNYQRARLENGYENATHDIWKVFYGEKSCWLLLNLNDFYCMRKIS